MAILLGGGRVNHSTPPATSLRIQTSLNGQPIAIVHGQNRLAGNLIWYGGFTSSKGGKSGKGGGAKAGGSPPSYSADVAIALCEGPLNDVLTVWSDQTVSSLSTLNLSVFQGGPSQAPWGFLAANFPAAALGYSCLGYVSADPYNLGVSPALPNLNFELRGAISGAVTETYNVASPYTFAATYFTLATSVVEQAAIPPGTYQIQAQNWQASNALGVVAEQIPSGSIIGSTSQGVIDLNGRIFTRDAGSPTGSGHYNVGTAGLYTFHSSDVGLQVTIIDLAIGPGVNYCYKRPSTNLTVGSTTVSSVSTIDLAAGQAVLGNGILPGTVIASVGSSTVTLSQAATQTGTSVALTFVGEALEQVLASPGVGEFSISVQPGAYGQYLFSADDAGSNVMILDVPDANPADSLADFLTNPRYGCGLPIANVGDLSVLAGYAYAHGLFISPAIVASQAANSYLNDFSTAVNGEFVWSAGQLGFVPYGDTAISGFDKSYEPPSDPAYLFDDDDYLKNEGSPSVGVSAFTSNDPVVCARKRPSDAINDVKIEYLDRGNSYNPAIAEAQDDAAINLYGLRPADTRQLHFFCMEQAALTSAQLQLGRQQIRNLYSFTVPWYFILLDPMDVIAISDSALGLDQQWVRIREISENQQDGSLTIVAEEYLTGAGIVAQPLQFSGQPKLGFTPNYGAAAPGIN